MGVSLSYGTDQDVPAEAKAIIEREARELASKHDWWAESINFFDHPDYAGRLFGDTKLFLIGYSLESGGYVAVDPDEDSLMAWRDAKFIVENLCRWSKNHRISWKLILEGESVGSISGGQPSDDLMSCLDEMKEFTDISPKPQTIEEINRKYASRWDPSAEPPEQPDLSDEKPSEPTEERRPWWKFW